MFKSYKPRGERIRAVQFTLQSASKLAEMFMGRLKMSEAAPSVVAGLDIPTFEGTKSVGIQQWIIRRDDGRVEVMDNSEFCSQYELAYGREAKE